jgi:hypothetical protein
MRSQSAGLTGAADGDGDADADGEAEADGDAEGDAELNEEASAACVLATAAGMAGPAPRKAAIAPASRAACHRGRAVSWISCLRIGTAASPGTTSTDVLITGERAG